MRVLVADGSADSRRFIVEALGGMPFRFRLSEVGNGKDCMERLASDEFDFAFVDLKLPQLSGLEILRAARSKRLRTIIVVMSGEADEDKICAARQLRAYDFLTRPFGAEQVRGVLDNYRQLVRSADVLIVDDSATVRRIVRKVLDKSFFNLRIDEVDNGAAALQRVQRKSYDLIFLDLNMPGLNGVETLPQLRAANADTLVVLITAMKPAELGDDVRSAGFEAILHKPFFPDDIDQILHRLYKMHARQIAQDETFVIDFGEQEED